MTIKTAHAGKLGTILVAADGKTLYLFEKDNGTKYVFHACDMSNERKVEYIYKMTGTVGTTVSGQATVVPSLSSKPWPGSFSRKFGTHAITGAATVSPKGSNGMVITATMTIG
jgi:hypothetical protein